MPQEVATVCGTLLEQGRGDDPTSPEGRRIVDLVRTSNEVSKRAACSHSPHLAVHAQSNP